MAIRATPATANATAAAAAPRLDRLAGHAIVSDGWTTLRYGSLNQVYALNPTATNVCATGSEVLRLRALSVLES